MQNSFTMEAKIQNQSVMEIRRLMAKYALRPQHLAMNLCVEPIRISEILRGRRNITADTDLRLARFFELPEGHFLALQMKYDLAATKGEIAGKLAKIKPVSETAIGQSS